MEDYIASFPAPSRGALIRVRNAIRKALPDAVESISYKMPTYKLEGRVVLHFAGWKEHCSVYLANTEVVAEFKAELAAFAVAKGTIRFPFSEPIPTELIGRIAAFRASKIAEHVVADPR